MDTRGASEGKQREPARIDAATDRDQPDPFRHVGIDDAVNALRRRHPIDVEPCGNGVHRAGGGFAVEVLPAAEETHRVEKSEHQVGVGHSGRGPTTPVAGRPRVGAGTARTDVQYAARVDVGDRAAAGANARDVQTVQGDPMAGDPPVGGDRSLTLDDERHVGARAAHVEGDEIAMFEDPARVACRRHPAGRPREDSTGGEPDRVGHSRESAVRLHDEDRPGVARVGQAFGEALEVALQHRADVRVDHRRADPLELLAAVSPDALAHRQAQMTRDQGIRGGLAERVVVVLESLAHLQDVAMPLGGEQAEPGSLAFEQRIGRDGGPVDDAIRRAEQRGPLNAERAGEQLQPGEHADRLIPRRRGGFGDHSATVVVDGNEIGERAAYVDADPVAGHCAPPDVPFPPPASSVLDEPVTNPSRRSRWRATALRSPGSPHPPPPPERT